MWLALYFPSLPLDALGLGKSTTPSVLLNRRGNRVLVANQAAQQQGVLADMPLAHALTVYSDLIIEMPSQIAEQQLLDSLCQWLCQFSATVCQRENSAICIEIASMLQYFRGITAIHKAILDSIPEFISQYHIRLAPTPLLALWRARCQTDFYPRKNRESDEALLSLGIEHWLREIKITATEWGAQYQKRLFGLGIRRIDQLYRLPAAELRQHLGDFLYQQFGKAIGTISDPQPIYNTPDVFRRQLTFIQEVEYSLGLLFPLRAIIEQLGIFLRHRRWHLYELTLTLQFAWLTEQNDKESTLLIRHDMGSDQAKLWLELVEQRLNKTVLSAPVRGLVVSSGRWEPSLEESGDLFDSGGLKRREEGEFLSRLSARLGEEAICVGGMTGDHLPESNLQFQTFSMARGAYIKHHPVALGKSISSLPSILSPSGFQKQMFAVNRPCWLLTRPQAIDVSHFVLLGGPERMASHWWDNPTPILMAPVRRDYCKAKYRDGRVAWIFRDDHKQWYLHGWFG